MDEGDEPFLYVKKLEKVLELLECGESIDGEQVEEELGVDVSAHRSVPTAIYSFVRALKPIPNIEVCPLFPEFISKTQTKIDAESVACGVG